MSDQNSPVEIKSKRRVRLATIDFNKVWSFLTRKQPQPGSFIRFDRWDLPEDCKVVSVFPDHARAAFVFVIQSESFDEVEDCFVPPDQPVTSCVVEIAVKENFTE
jgi:hypothetical protein